MNFKEKRLRAEMVYQLESNARNISSKVMSIDKLIKKNEEMIKILKFEKKFINFMSNIFSYAFPGMLMGGAIIGASQSQPIPTEVAALCGGLSATFCLLGIGMKNACGRCDKKIEEEKNKLKFFRPQENENSL